MRQYYKTNYHYQFHLKIKNINNFLFVIHKKHTGIYD